MGNFRSPRHESAGAISRGVFGSVGLVRGNSKLMQSGLPKVVKSPAKGAETRDRVAMLKAAVENKLIGCSGLVERLLIGLLTGGHVLIEGVPGLAKTRAVKCLAAGLDVSFERIQCTPDLMPADITGTPVWRPDRGILEFVPGPVFHSLVLVDEINRATPEDPVGTAGSDGRATGHGRRHDYELPDPFMVVATQNPIEHEGTFPLPEAQLDRFLLYTVVELPGAAADDKSLILSSRRPSNREQCFNSAFTRRDQDCAARGRSRTPRPRAQRLHCEARNRAARRDYGA